MKKKLFLMACLAVWGVQMSNAQSGTIALHHEGKVTIYDSGNIQSAVDASVKGDTLYLSEGTFWRFYHHKRCCCYRLRAIHPYFW